jgi:hypothetical protein
MLFYKDKEIIWALGVDPQVGSVWPLVPASAVFLYLWWLGILIFDLVFVWHRYVRFSKALDVLHEHFEWNINQKRAKKTAAETQQK